MYSHHFGLSQDPFSIAPDPRYLFMSERHREALAHLLYGVAGAPGAAGGTGGGFVLLTGDIGTGKTTICRCFMEQIPAGCHVAYIFNPRLSAAELLQSVCEEFRIAVAPASGVPTLKQHIDALNDFLLQSHAAGQSSVLIIDEAQNLSADVLEQLRLLTNLETNERKLLQIVLIGQPELRTMLARPELEQLAQRVIARFHLDALTEAESAQYIAHRLAVAGYKGPPPFDPPALRRIHRLARGVPRRLNLLCGRALLGAWANGLDRVNRKVVDKAAAEVFGAAAGPAGAGRPAAYALGGAAVLAGAALAGWWLWGPAPQRAGQAPALAGAVPPAPAPQPAASSGPGAAGGARVASGAVSPQEAVAPAAPAAPAAAGPLEEVEALLSELPAGLDDAWRALAPAWKLSLPPEGDPCEAAGAQQWQCHRTDILTMPLLRQLDRPGILTLQPPGGAPVQAVLVGLSEHSATLQVGERRRTVRLVPLARLWRGDFATFWRPPSGYAPGLQGASAAPAVAQLARQLSLLDGAPAPDGAAAAVLDAALRARVRAFQRAQGLDADGKPGPLTFMQLDSATGAAGPRLQAGPPHQPRTDVPTAR